MQVAVCVSALNGNSSAADLQAIAVRVDAVKLLFAERLGLEPFEESRSYISYLVPRDSEHLLMPFLKELEQKKVRGGGAMRWC
jgi:hypothetical protein